MRLRVRVIPLTKKMREKVKAHGDVWVADDVDRLGPGEQVTIATLKDVHRCGDRTYPYMRTVIVGHDCDLDTMVVTAKKVEFNVVGNPALTPDRAYLTIDGKVVGTIENIKGREG